MKAGIPSVRKVKVYRSGRGRKSKVESTVERVDKHQEKSTLGSEGGGLKKILCY